MLLDYVSWILALANEREPSLWKIGPLQKSWIVPIALLLILSQLFPLRLQFPTGKARTFTSINIVSVIAFSEAISANMSSAVAAAAAAIKRRQRYASLRSVIYTINILSFICRRLPHICIVIQSDYGERKFLQSQIEHQGAWGREWGLPLRYMIGSILTTQIYDRVFTPHSIGLCKNDNNRKEGTNVSFRVRVEVSIPNSFMTLKTLYLSKVLPVSPPLRTSSICHIYNDQNQFLEVSIYQMQHILQPYESKLIYTSPWFVI